MDAPISSKKLFSIREVCALTGRSRSAIYQDLKAGLLPALKCGRRTFVRSTDLDTFINDMAPYPAAATPYGSSR